MMGRVMVPPDFQSADYETEGILGRIEPLEIGASSIIQAWQ